MGADIAPSILPCASPFDRLVHESGSAFPDEHVPRPRGDPRTSSQETVLEAPEAASAPAPDVDGGNAAGARSIREGGTARLDNHGRRAVEPSLLGRGLALSSMALALVQRAITSAANGYPAPAAPLDLPTPARGVAPAREHEQQIGQPVEMANQHGPRPAPPGRARRRGAPARRQTVRARWSWAASAAPPGRMKLLSSGSSRSRRSIQASRSATSASPIRCMRARAVPGRSPARRRAGTGCPEPARDRRRCAVRDRAHGRRRGRR